MVVVIAKYYSSSLYSYYYSQTVDVDAEEDVANFQFEILRKKNTTRGRVLKLLTKYKKYFCQQSESERELPFRSITSKLKD